MFSLWWNSGSMQKKSSRRLPFWPYASAYRLRRTRCLNSKNEFCRSMYVHRWHHFLASIWNIILNLHIRKCWMLKMLTPVFGKKIFQETIDQKTEQIVMWRDTLDNYLNSLREDTEFLLFFILNTLVPLIKMPARLLIFTFIVLIFVLLFQLNKEFAFIVKFTNQHVYSCQRFY